MRTIAPMIVLDYIIYSHTNLHLPYWKQKLSSFDHVNSVSIFGQHSNAMFVPQLTAHCKNIYWLLSDSGFKVVYHALNIGWFGVKA